MRKFYATLLVFMALCCASLYSSATNLNQDHEPSVGSEPIEVSESTEDQNPEETDPEDTDPENPDLEDNDPDNPENPDNPDNPGNEDDIEEPEEPVKKTEFNALRIVLNSDSEETEHFIAIDGNNLKLKVRDNVIKLSNSKLGVKYNIDEISHFVPVRYEFEDGKYFIGEHDINVGIEAVREYPLVLSLEGDMLSIKGIKRNKSVRMYSASGMLIAYSRVENETALFRTSTLQRGVYIMNVDGKSIKVLIGR